MNTVVTFKADGKQFRVEVGGIIKLETKGIKKMEDSSSFDNLVISEIELIEPEDGSIVLGRELKNYSLILTPKRKERSKKIETMKFKKRKRYRRYLTTRREYIVYEVTELKKK